MIELLAVLSASAAAGMRVALPLLMIGLLQGSNLWSEVPILGRFSPSVVLGILVSWSLLELLASKERIIQRFLQILQLIFSPLVGALLSIVVAKTAGVPIWLIGILGGIGGLLALVLQLVMVGWFYRLRGLPLWVIVAQDGLCVVLVLFAFDAPQQGGLIALLLLWLAIRSSKEWRRWYLAQTSAKTQQRHPRQGKLDPD